MEFIRETRLDGSPLPDGKVVSSLLSYFSGLRIADDFKEQHPDAGNETLYNIFDGFSIGEYSLSEYFILCLMSQARHHGIKYVSITNYNIFSPQKKVRSKNVFSQDYMFTWEVVRYYNLRSGAGNGWGSWSQSQIYGNFSAKIFGIWSCFEEKKFNVDPFAFGTTISEVEDFTKRADRNEYEKYDPFK